MITPFVIKRVSLSLFLGLLLGAGMNELTFIWLRETTRAPKLIELVIPAGTADSVARGEKPPSIPDSMTFVVGDEFMVHNLDVVTHKLGPLWIPAGSSASLKLDSVQSYAVECSFQPGKYFGLDVHEPLTLSTRIYGILYAGLPAGGLLALYSLLIPARVRKEK